MPFIDDENNPLTKAVIYSASCYDPSHPPSNLLDPDVNKFWVTTGCFPQEIILQFASPIRIGRITVLANKAKTIDLDYTTEDPSGKWSALGTLKMTNNTDSFQNEILTLSDPTDVLYLKFTITSAFDDFVSLHKLRIETK